MGLHTQPHNTEPVIELRQGPLRLALRPDLGGAVAGLWWGGVPVLRSTEPAALRRAADAALYAQLPYAQRIGGGSFAWRGRRYTLDSTVADEPHALHGVAWQRAWQVGHCTDTAVTLAYTHPGNMLWPFAFHAEQTFELGEATLRITLAVSNIDARDTPIGLGWCAHVVRRPGSRVQMALAQRWERDGAGLPTHRVPCGGLEAAVAALDLDHGFDGWSGPALMADDTLALRLTSSLTRVAVHTPPEREHFCIAPVSHVNNALCSPDPAARGVIALDSGNSVEAWLQLDVAHL